MKLLYKYQWGSFFDHQDGWRTANKQRRTTLRHAIKRQRPSRRNLSLHPQWIPTRQLEINRNQEWLMREEQATVRMLQRKGKILLNGLQALTRYIQPSIMQHRIAFTGEFYHPNLILNFAKFKYGGWSSLKNISCHVSNLSWSSLPLWCAQLA